MSMGLAGCNEFALCTCKVHLWISHNALQDRSGVAVKPKSIRASTSLGYTLDMTYSFPEKDLITMVDMGCGASIVTRFSAPAKKVWLGRQQTVDCSSKSITEIEQGEDPPG